MGAPVNEFLTQTVGFPDVTNYLTGLTTATAASAAIDLSKFRKVAAERFVTALGSAAVITLSVYGCATSGGTFVALTNYSMTTNAAGAIVLETSAQSVQNYNTANGTAYKFIKFYAGATVSSAVTVTTIGAAGPEQPQSNTNSASVLGVKVV